MNNPGAPDNLLDYYGNIPGTGAKDAFGAMMYSITMGIVWFITVAVSPWQAGRNLMAKSEHVTFRSGAIAAMCTVVFLLFLNLQSVAVINLNPNLEDPQRVLIWAAFNVMPQLVGTLVLAGIMAAGLSSASTFMSVVGFSVTSDIVKINFKSEREQLRFSRMVMLIVGVLALVLAYGLGWNPDYFMVCIYNHCCKLGRAWYWKCGQQETFFHRCTLVYDCRLPGLYNS